MTFIRRSKAGGRVEQVKENLGLAKKPELAYLSGVRLSTLYNYKYKPITNVIIYVGDMPQVVT